MNVIVVYDSLYGNTAKVAQAVAEVFSKENLQLIQINEIHMSELVAMDLLIAGSPTHGGRPSPTMQSFLANVTPQTLMGVRVAAFDTRVLAADQSALLRAIINVIGYAAPRILDSLRDKGAEPVGLPAGFIVEGKEGPLRKGELERAAAWAKGIFDYLNSKS